ncbi:MAG: ribonuclease H-like domain-containing protein [Bacteroidetes bacterium]|nr:ribonuclease H-like domain-containing protein [Bacteroidota bacterium]MBU1579075.1 ribonuclease H-like domain-containing protein [Bacteroidota bacterium]MBU2556457.1 ribonuclease H-like domain-containing protein [Bacteroidota bacterium]
MLYNLQFSQVLFLDIETVPASPKFDDLSERMQKLWVKKADKIRKSEDETAGELYSRAGIYSEFGKIIVISVGFLNGHEFRIKSFYSDNEKLLLEEFAELLNRYYNYPDSLLCAHNGKEFDFPYIARRMVINGIDLPLILQIAGKKPWEIKHLDTMELWKFGDYKNYTSLDLLTAIFDIPTPKDDIDGSMVGGIYWEQHDLERIKEYCQKDVLAIAQLMRRYLNQPLLAEDQIVLAQQ